MGGTMHSANATSNRLSAFGKRKWRDYRATGEAIPADIGGVHILVTEDNLTQCENVLKELSLTKPSDDPNIKEMFFFQHLLQGSDADLVQLLNRRFGNVREKKIGASGTCSHSSMLGATTFVSRGTSRRDKSVTASRDAARDEARLMAV